MKLEFKLHSLTVYSMESAPTFLRSKPQTYYYWRDATTPQDYGPFETIYQCVHHYEASIKQIKALYANPDAKVIVVDFRSKAKVIPIKP